MKQDNDEIREILKKAYQIEVDGYTFYSMTAERAAKPAVQELFDKLARDEVQHKAYLQSVIGSYEEKGLAAFTCRAATLISRLSPTPSSPTSSRNRRRARTSSSARCPSA